MLRFRFNHRLTLIFATVILVVLVVVPVCTFAQTTSTTVDQFGVSQASFDVLQAPNTDLRGAIVRVVQYLLGFLGVLMVIIIAYGGYVWMTSGDNADRIATAKKIIINATIGLIIILTAFAIVSLIFRELGNGLNGGGTPCPGCRNDRWRSGIGLGPIESVYPEPNQHEVPINTWIAVTFKEQIDPATICEAATDGTCQGGKMKNVSICALGSDGGCIVDDPARPDLNNFSADEFAATTVQQTKDGRTFVFSPNKYLGLEDSADRDFYVVLKSGIASKTTGKSIFASWGGQQFHWQFTTNGELDLDPPEIVSTNTILNPKNIESVSGVFPDPDNQADTYSLGTAPTPTKFSFVINRSTDNIAIQSQVAAAVTTPQSQGTSPSAQIQGVYGGTVSGVVTTTIGNDGKPTTVYPGGQTVRDDAYNNGSVFTVGNGLEFKVGSVPPNGSQWTFTVTAPRDGDAIEVLDGSSVVARHVFGVDIQKGATSPVTMTNIKLRLLASHSDIFKDCTDIVACLSDYGVETIATGDAGSRYQVRFSPAGDDTARSGLVQINRTVGTNTTENTTIKGRPDIARNAIFQINFNEAVNPLVVDAGVFSVAYGKSAPSTLDGTAAATVSISNQYRTVELLGTEPCPGQSVNQCGAPISCWPINDLLKANPNDYAHKATQYQVSITAAPLRTCAGIAGQPELDNWCTLWQGNNRSCVKNERCTKTVGNQAVYYPGVDLSLALSGLIDMSGNSLNGSFNYFVDPNRSNKVIGIAEGQSGATGGGRSGRPVYNLNSTNPLYASSTPLVVFKLGWGFGDSFVWSFFISDKVELRPPLVRKILPIGDQHLSDLRRAVEVTFDKIMRSVTLRPGWNYGDAGDGRSRSERYLIFDTITKGANPVGYWISNFGKDENEDQFPDYTQALIAHSQLDPNITYGPQAGSGLQDIYQNCLLPGAGPDNATAVTCSYINNTSTSTQNCVTDVNAVGHTPVQLPNPASYAALNCKDVVGAQQCKPGQNCIALYEDVSTTTPDAGSLIVTKDFPSKDLSKGSCCLGICTNP